MSETSAHAGAFEQVYCVPFQEVDAAGVVFFAHPFTRAHEVYEAFMEQIGVPLSTLRERLGIGLPIVHAHSDYMVPMRHGERVRVVLSLARLGDASFTTACEFQDASGRPLARVGLAHCCIAVDTGRPCPLPEALRERLRGAAQATPA